MVLHIIFFWIFLFQSINYESIGLKIVLYGQYISILSIIMINISIKIIIHKNDAIKETWIPITIYNNSNFIDWLWIWDFIEIDHNNISISKLFIYHCQWIRHIGIYCNLIFISRLEGQLNNMQELSSMIRSGENGSNSKIKRDNKS